MDYKEAKDRSRELDREVEREREKQREKEIREFREFSTKLPIKQPAAPQPIAGGNRRSRGGDQPEPMMKAMGGGAMNWNTAQLQPVNPHAALLNPINDNNPIMPPINSGNGPFAGKGGGGMKGAPMRDVLTPNDLLSPLPLNSNPNNLTNIALTDPLASQAAGTRKTPRTLAHMPPLDNNTNNSIAQPPSNLMTNPNNGLRSRGGARPQPQLVSLPNNNPNAQWEAGRPPFANQRTPPQTNYPPSGKISSLAAAGGEISTGFSPRFQQHPNGFALEPPPSRQKNNATNYGNVARNHHNESEVNSLFSSNNPSALPQIYSQSGYGMGGGGGGQYIAGGQGGGGGGFHDSQQAGQYRGPPVQGRHGNPQFLDNSQVSYGPSGYSNYDPYNNSNPRGPNGGNSMSMQGNHHLDQNPPGGQFGRFPVRSSLSSLSLS